MYVKARILHMGQNRTKRIKRVTCFKHIHRLQVLGHVFQCYSLQVGFCVSLVPVNTDKHNLN